MKRKLKLILGPIIIVATLTAFAWYIAKHPAVLDQLRDTSLATVLQIILLYIVILVALTIISVASVQLCRAHMKVGENFLLTSYTALLNFFGPGQSGPGFRGIYLKVRHNIAFKQYIFVTLIYYAFYAIFSGILLFFAYSWWKTLIASLLIAAFSYLVIRWYVRKNRRTLMLALPAKVYIRGVGIIAAGTLLQIITTTLVYYVELRSVGSHASITQVMAYSGAANFALFVALTPGAIGIREAFLVFSSDIHHISNSTIVAANVLDRAVYLVFLGLVFLLVISMHAQKKLQIKT